VKDKEKEKWEDSLESWRKWLWRPSLSYKLHATHSSYT